MSVNSYVTFRQAIVTASAAAISTLLLVVPVNLQAQVLEEIIVTAQRREQSLQDVPIAIDVITGDTLQKQGFNNLEELSAFTPAVFVNEGGDQGSDVFIRGFGTVGRNWANDSATPLFLDNVNLGQASMGTIGFMDTQRVEVLKGPQPIHFGLNATGGALSIVSARPTDTWEGYVNTEVNQAGSMTIWKRFGGKELEGAIGGPITDTLNFRLAGLYSTKDGYLIDSVTGYPMGFRNFIGGRASLQWSPTDNLSIYTKLELAQQEWAGASRTCRRPEGAYPERFMRTPSTPTFANVETDPNAVWLGFDEGGTGWATPIMGVDECGQSYEYLGQTYVREQPTVNIRTRDTTTGFPDIRLASAFFLNNVAGGTWEARPTKFGNAVATNLPLNPQINGYKGDGTGITSNRGYMADQSMEPKNVQVDLNYRFDNNIEIQWTNAYMESYYMDGSADRNTPYAENIRIRVEDYNQKSSEVRISQPEGTIQWMLGAFIQAEKLHFTTIDARAEIRFNNRMNDNYQDATWTSYFGNLTYNFYENKMSLDGGIRYSRAHKDPTLNSYNSSWIFDVTPCTGRAPTANPNIWRGDTSDWGGKPVQDLVPADCTKGLEGAARRISAADAMYLIPDLPNRDVNTNNLWFVPVSTQRFTPGPWRGNYTAAVGMTPWSTEQRPGESWRNIALTWDHWDPQVVLRYRPSDDMSTYFKYATAFKAGAYDLGFGGSQPISTTPGGYDELLIDPEYSETFEFGVSGKLFDGRGRYRATLFRVDFDDLIATTVTDVGTDTQSTVVVNIGAQRAQGLELDGQYLVTDQLQLSGNFSYLDSKFTNFPDANCTEHETRNFEESGCQIIFKPNFPHDISDFNNILVAVIDRAGQTAAFAPEFSFSGTVDYEMPFKDEYKIDTGVTTIWSSQYYTDFRTFSKASIQDGSMDLNLHLGIGDADGKWRVGLALRNLLEPRETFRPEYTSNISELGGGGLRSNQVRSVALTFKYNFFE